MSGTTGQDLDVHYQPVLRARSGEVVGIEALLRMRGGDSSFDPDHHLSGLRAADVDVAAFVVRRAIADLRYLDAVVDRPLWCAVNVDAIDLERGGLVPSIAEVFDESGAIDPSRLVLEVTERHPVGSAHVDGVLAALRGLGVRLAVDDFGTGESALRQFECVAPDIVKIDRSFVAEVESSGDGRSMVEVVLALARRARLTVIAEGVERVGQLRTLRELGCPLVQGHLFAPAMPLEDLRALLTPTSDLGEREVTAERRSVLMG